MPHSAPRPSAGAEDFMPIEADLEAFSPGRVAAVGVRSRLAEGERAFSTFMSITAVLTQRAERAISITSGRHLDLP